MNTSIHTTTAENTAIRGGSVVAAMVVAINVAFARTVSFISKRDCGFMAERSHEHGTGLFKKLSQMEAGVEM